MCSRQEKRRMILQLDMQFVHCPTIQAELKAIKEFQ